MEIILSPDAYIITAWLPCESKSVVETTLYCIALDSSGERINIPFLTFASLEEALYKAQDMQIITADEAEELIQKSHEVEICISPDDRERILKRQRGGNRIGDFKDVHCPALGERGEENESNIEL